jgi:hypothetical protein
MGVDPYFCLPFNFAKCITIGAVIWSKVIQFICFIIFLFHELWENENIVNIVIALLTMSCFIKFIRGETRNEQEK